MPSSSDSDRIAVLIDADNTSPKHVSALMEEVATFGTATVKRAYGDWTTSQLGGWKSKLNQHAIQPMQQFAYTTGKNSTDSALIIDAMDLLYSGNVDTFALVSSDSDFTRLATRLRESGMRVVGLGLRKTPQSLVSAVDRFVYLELLDAEPAPGAPVATPEEETGQAPARQPDLRRLFTNAVNAASHDDGWASLSSVSNQINRSNPSFDSRDHGQSKLINLARKQSYLDVEQLESGGVRVRLTDSPGTKAAPSAEAAPATKTASAPRTRRATTKKAAVAEPVVEPVAEPVAQPVVEPVVAAPEEAPSTAPKVTTRRRTRKTAAAPDA